MKRLLFVAGCALALTAHGLFAAPYDEMDYGPFVSATYQLPGGNTTLRGIAVSFHVPIEGEAVPAASPAVKGRPKQPPVDPAATGVVFDTELLRYSGWWNGGFITWTGVVFNGSHGANPGPAGKVSIATKVGPGWAKDGQFLDPRPLPYGPLPRDWGRYKGLYRHEKGVVFSYTVGDVQVLDMPGVVVHDKVRAFCRTLNVSASKEPLLLVLADVPGKKSNTNVGIMARVDDGQNATLVRVFGPKGVQIESTDRILLRISASDQPSQIKISLWHGPKADADTAARALDKTGGPIDLAPLTKGGKARFTETATTKGVVGSEKDAYTLDSLTPPFKNPYKSWMRFGGIDFFSDGRAAISTWSGDVWIVSGIDDKLEKLTWKRYASGLFHALGLKIVNDQVYVLGRDQITRLHDLNGDGEADFYECFNNEAFITTNFHEFTFDLHTDPAGNFYFIKGGPVRPGGSGWDKITPHHGCIFKVSKDGSKLEVVARGFRAPNGMCVGPHGEITTGDNEGTWTPTCPINWIKPGGFYGVPDFAGKKKEEFPKMRDNPLCWLPHDDVDNSNGGQVWITSDKFGPLSRQLLHSSYGRCKLYLVMKEDVGGQKQGGVVHIPLKFDSGISRMRFREADNALYITGLRGWQTNAAKDAGFYRVRYTGKKANLPIDLKVRPGQIAVTFSDPIDKSSADPDYFSVRHWNYRWTSNYGSAHYKVSDPKQQIKKNAEEELEVQSVDVSPDGRTIALKIDGLKPVMQMKIQYKLKAADGAPMNSAIWHTINVVGNQRGEVHVGEFRVVETKK